MNRSHSNGPRDPALSGRGGSQAEHQPLHDTTEYRGHLPPPFYNAKDEDLSGRRYPPEVMLSRHTPEDVGNYGRGGYYGHTYDQENISGKRFVSDDSQFGSRDSYRHLGDSRRPEPGNQSWEAERPFRSGYSSTRDRFGLTGMHQGKGPRSYRRSDDRILEDVNDRLYDDPYLNASEIETEARDGDIILSGTVESRQAKRRAEDIAEMVSGVRNVENRLRITPPERMIGNR